MPIHPLIKIPKSNIYDISFDINKQVEDKIFLQIMGSLNSLIITRLPVSPVPSKIYIWNKLTIGGVLSGNGSAVDSFVGGAGVYTVAGLKRRKKTSKKGSYKNISKNKTVKKGKKKTSKKGKKNKSVKKPKSVKKKNSVKKPKSVKNNKSFKKNVN
jgi:hypothetical protein